MMIQNRELTGEDIYSPVTYVPRHVKGNTGHRDCERGVLISWNEEAGFARVLYCTGRNIQATNPKDLVWG